MPKYFLNAELKLFWCVNPVISAASVMDLLSSISSRRAYSMRSLTVY